MMYNHHWTLQESYMSKIFLDRIAKPFKKSLFYKDAEILLDDNLYQKLKNLKISNTDIWIRLYKQLNENDKIKIRELYINKLATELTPIYTLANTINILNATFQYYQPLVDTRIQQIIIEQIKSTTRATLKDLGSNINQLINGQTLTSEYAKNLLVTIVDVHVQQNIPSMTTWSAKTKPFYENLQQSLQLPLSLSTFETLMNHMNQHDYTSAQLLILLIMNPEGIKKAPHLSKYQRALDMIDKETPINKLMQNISMIETANTMYIVPTESINDLVP